MKKIFCILYSLLHLPLCAQLSATLAWDEGCDTNISVYEIVSIQSAYPPVNSGLEWFTNNCNGFPVAAHRYAMTNESATVIYFSPSNSFKAPLLTNQWYIFAVSAVNNFGLKSSLSEHVTFKAPPGYLEGGPPPVLSLSVHSYATNFYTSSVTNGYSLVPKTFQLFSDMYIENAWKVWLKTNFSSSWWVYWSGSNSVVRIILTNEYPMAFFKLEIIPSFIASPNTNSYAVGQTSGNNIDTMFDLQPYINASRYYCASNTTMTQLFAKIPGDSPTARYKFAVYSDFGGNPLNLLGQSSEVIGPTNGWHKMNLNAPMTFTANTYYWLAAWSDSTTSRMYYNDASVPLKWMARAYGLWPTNLSVSGGGNASYSIYVK